MDINTNLNILPMGMQKAQSAVHPGANQQPQNRVQEAYQAEETQKAKAEHSTEELEDIVDKIQETVKIMQRNLNFSIHDNTGMTVVKVMDAGSGEVIRQMPTEDALVLAERLDEMRSLLFEARA